MSETKHTPLPWTTGVFRLGIEITHGHESIAEIAPYREAVDGGVVSKEELDKGIANAKLIITSVNARPEMEKLVAMILALRDKKGAMITGTLDCSDDVRAIEAKAVDVQAGLRGEKA